MSSVSQVLAAALGLVLSSAGVCHADGLTLKVADGYFDPPSVTIGANSPTKLLVVNSGNGPAEVESFELNRERVVMPGQSASVLIPALKAGIYHFFDDFHRGAGQLSLIAK